MKRLALLLLTFAVGCMTLHAQHYTSPTGKVLSIDADNYYVHIAKQGETLSSLALLYDVAESRILGANEPLGWSGDVNEGDVLRIPCDKRVRELRPKRDSSEYIYHTLVAGESLFEVAKEFAVSLDVIIEDNPTLDITCVEGYSTLLIRQNAIKQTNMETLGKQSEEYAKILTRLSAEYEYFVVSRGQTLYSLARTKGVDVDTFKSLNANPSVLYIGMMLKAPVGQKVVVPSQEAESTNVEPSEPIEPTEEVELLAQNDEPESQTSQQESQWGVMNGVYDYLRSLITARAEGTTYREFFNRNINISMMLPLTDQAGRVRGSFVEFYQGALIAAEDMKAQGYSVNINLYDTRNSADHVKRLMWSERKIKDTDLFIGPIYERNAEAVLDYAMRKGIPVVSPLETSISGEHGDCFFRMAPTDTNKYEKLRSLITPNANVVLVYTPTVNQAMESKILPMLEGVNYTKIVYDEEFEVESKEAPTLQTALQRRNNLVFVMSNTEVEVDRMLTMTASVMNRYASARNSSAIRVVGDNSWMRYKNIDRNLFFKLNVSFVANYHYDRTEERVLEFDAKYLQSFGNQPSLFSYRAYDAVMLFSTALFNGGGVQRGLESITEPMLRTPYNFVYQDGIMVNNYWPFVQYMGSEIRVE